MVVVCYTRQDKLFRTYLDDKDEDKGIYVFLHIEEIDSTSLTSVRIQKLSCHVMCHVMWCDVYALCKMGIFWPSTVPIQILFLNKWPSKYDSTAKSKTCRERVRQIDEWVVYKSLHSSSMMIRKKKKKKKAYP